MATGVSDVDVSNDEFFTTQDKAIEEHVQKLHRKLDEFEGLVKSTMRSLGRNASPHYLTMTFLFLTQIFRNLSDVVAAKGESTSDVAKHLAPLSGQAEPATTSTTPASSSTASFSSRPPSSLSQRTSFTTRTDKDTETPRIKDVKLLPGGWAVLADEANWCVKLFTIAGQHLHSVRTDGSPQRLAIVDVMATHSWQVAVILDGVKKIAMLEVAQHGVTVKRTIPTSRYYWAIEAIDSNTIAVGYLTGRGIDLIDHTGNVIRQISSDLHSYYMVSSADRCLVITTFENEIAKVNIKDGSAVYRHKVGQVKFPHGIACHQDGSCIITDRPTRTLHLVTSDGVWVKQIWAHPAGADPGDQLSIVCMFQNMCLCCTWKGSVFVLDIS